MKTISQEKIRTLMMKNHDIKLPGAALLFLADVLKEKQITLISAIESGAKLGLTPKSIEELYIESEANEAMGGLMLSMISDVFGDDFMNKFIRGEISLPEPTVEMQHGHC